MSSRPSAPQTLFPAPPHQQKGWGRFKRIVTEYSTANMELKLGFGSTARGIWLFITELDSERMAHTFVWTGIIPLLFWGMAIFVLGALQMYSCLYRWDRMRSWVSLLLSASLGYMVVKYMLYDIWNIAVPLYGTLLLGQIWIALRGPGILGKKTTNGDAIHDI